jgi:hypothetical protein
MKQWGSARAALAFVLFGAAGVFAAGCCCATSEKPESSPLQQCLDSCSIAQVNCNYLCKGDAQCSRSCADAYHTCIKICADHEKGTVTR